ncbi:aldehyde dehydrogenase family protein [Gluconacetobacter azotocaptans]|uniref:aldehyde dehydrogenase (NAD(+)) n=1 Tax=Gluconacetobacter azotocaptans TaxID=142834 RepID=A0A7W4PFN6_9PROT|nr:aldehyde dehydrogenase family protein [Gluconacetobacter azotocaptans]MBB2190769.1 aldehyde dehydrogenase family protein [Gluconacetobacter azotocaptans]GBQ30720.1 NAD-dependent aldehyde dehydrogenase [Gluconacetobacter azotocaptans DSM 13594]
MQEITHVYIDGQFIEPHGTELFDLHNPTTGEVFGHVRLGDVHDTRAAIAAAKRAFPEWSRTTKAERISLLHRLHDAMEAKKDALLDAIILEYGAPISRSTWMAAYASSSFLDAARTLEGFDLTQRIGTAELIMEPVGVSGLITPWNSNAGFICNKLAYALAAGCTAVIKPSEMSAAQTQVVLEALHEAGAPAGLFNIVNGRGDVVGAEISANPDISKISFTGSTAVGKSILCAAADTLKRVTLELGGKSPTVILDDADFAKAIPLALEAGFANSGQACIAGSRILVPASRLDEALAETQIALEKIKAGNPRDAGTTIGPMVSQTQYERVQHYIRLGIEEGATIVAGGEGHPDGLGGYFVRPTIFANVTNDMTIAREEIFGPVLCILTYKNEAEAISIANDTRYGLQAYVISSDLDRATAVAGQIQAGRIVINGAPHDPTVPFGGFKQSGIGREYGVFGLQAYLEPKALLGAASA